MGNYIVNFKQKNFHEAMRFLTIIGQLSDDFHHHPDVHLTEYKTVEIELSTPRLHGITEMDIQMIDLFDKIPVEYSLLWKHSHPNLVPFTSSVSSFPSGSIYSIQKEEDKEENVNVNVNVPHKHKYETVFPHRIHSQQNHVTLTPDLTTVHSQAISNEPGSVKHSVPFHISTATSIPLGKSDIQHHAEVYANQRPRSSSETVLIRRNPSNFETASESVAWNSMAHALQRLIDRGYDVGISTALLPMVNAHEVYPSWEDEMHAVYVHLNKRLSPLWLESEPPEIIDACREFVDGYNTIFADNFMT